MGSGSGSSRVTGSGKRNDSTFGVVRANSCQRSCDSVRIKQVRGGENSPPSLILLLSLDPLNSNHPAPPPLQPSFKIWEEIAVLRRRRRRVASGKFAVPPSTGHGPPIVNSEGSGEREREREREEAIERLQCDEQMAQWPQWPQWRRSTAEQWKRATKLRCGWALRVLIPRSPLSAKRKPEIK